MGINYEGTDALGLDRAESPSSVLRSGSRLWKLSNASQGGLAVDSDGAEQVP